MSVLSFYPKIDGRKLPGPCIHTTGQTDGFMQGPDGLGRPDFRRL